MTIVRVIDGDIAAVEADALLTAINSGGMWFGGIDGVIARAAGSQFHIQAADALAQQRDVKVVVAPKQSDHHGRFEDVVFVIDDLDESLMFVVFRGLDAAAAAGYKRISIPAIRLGVMKNVGGDVETKIDAIADALVAHMMDSEPTLDEVTIVTYNDPDLQQRFAAAIEANGILRMTDT